MGSIYFTYPARGIFQSGLVHEGEVVVTQLLG